MLGDVYKRQYLVNQNSLNNCYWDLPYSIFKWSEETILPFFMFLGIWDILLKLMLDISVLESILLIHQYGEKLENQE